MADSTQVDSCDGRTVQVVLCKREPSPQPTTDIPIIKVEDCDSKAQRLYRTGRIESIDDVIAEQQGLSRESFDYSDQDEHAFEVLEKSPPPPEIIEEACIIKPGVKLDESGNPLKESVDQDYDYPVSSVRASCLTRDEKMSSLKDSLAPVVDAKSAASSRSLSPDSQGNYDSSSPSGQESPAGLSDNENMESVRSGTTLGLQSSVAHMKTIGRRKHKSRKPSSLSPSPDRRNKLFGSVKVTELQEEGKNAIDSPSSPTIPDLPPQDYILDELEERSMIQPASYDDPKLKELMKVLIEWINDELADQRIIVKDIEEDLYDGQILQKLLEKLTGVKMDVVEVTQSEEGQKQKLKTVLDVVNKVLGLAKWNSQKWNVDSIHSKNVVAILHLLVALARHFRAPYRLPENVAVIVVVVQKRDGMLHTRTVKEELTSTYDDLGLRVERDAFDTLFDHAPDKLQVVKKSLITFVNKHLNKINLEVTDLDTQFHDGVYLTLLMGLLECYFVPLYNFNLTPTTFEQKVHNVAFAFELMHDASLPKPKARPEDIVNLDLKSTLRVLYNLFTKYKSMS